MMAPFDSTWNRLALLTTLVKRSPGLGRTAIMKLPFFLVTLRNVPLDYDFRLYTYGPFDSNVLGDLSYAESLGAVESELIPYSGGYRYEIRPGSKAENIEARGCEFLRRYDEDIQWVLRRFGRDSASNLELLSTIIYVDHEAIEEGQSLDIEELTTRVHDVKRHFSIDAIRSEAEALKREGLLQSVT